MMDIENMTLDQLKAKRDSIVESCSGWEKCNDGSYEMALEAKGYRDVQREIGKRLAEGKV